MPDVHLLGRSVVVAPGAPAPEPWEGCERVAVGAIDARLADDLEAAWRERRPLVIELTPGLGLDDPATPPPERVTGAQPWEWSVDLDLPADRLHHGVWANSLDARRAGDPPRWRWAAEAVKAGAALTEGPDRDIVLPDGTPAVCDAGPLDAGLAARLGLAVVHRAGLEHRSLRPLASPPPAGVDLAPDQLAAVAEPRAGARIIAPAGSGKTRVLTERARLLVRGWGLPTESMALVAYNVRAAGEMRDRLADVPGLRIRTLNALALRLCGRSTTIDEYEVRRILSDLVALPRRAESDPAAPWIEALSRVRLGLAAPDDVEDEVGDVSDLDRTARTYRQRLAERDAADFDEQITGAVERLLADPAFRERSRRFARVLLVDEFQDLTPAHLLLIRLLAGPAGAVFGVGDDDQTIYGYAGATPRWLVDFDRWFPGSASHPLEVNYRCPPAIVTAAANLLTRNSVRVDKIIRPAADRPGDPAALTVVADRAPATVTAGRVAELVASGVSPADVAVLSRVNASLIPVRVRLGAVGVAVNVAAETRFLQRGGVRAALAWLELAVAPAGALPGPALREAARRPKRGMSNSLLDLIARQRSEGRLESLAAWLEKRGSARDADKAEQFAADVSLVRRQAGRATTADLLQTVRDRVGAGGLDAGASALDQWSHGAIAAHLDDLQALSELAELEPDPARFGTWLAERLAEPGDPAGVTLASIHSVKGREWPHVFVHHVTAGLLPHRLAADTEEERRILHVGLTRAALSSTLVAGHPPSPFLAELAEPGVPPRPPRPPRPAGPGARDPARDRSRETTRDAARSQARGPARSASGPKPGAAELLPAAEGAAFELGGHEHRIVATGPDGAVSVIGEGPARTSTPYGTLVSAGGRPALLAHPAAGQAWEQLKAWRAERSRQLGKPAYVLFDDKTLKLLSARMPASEPAFLAVHGVGPVKFETYGSELMAILEPLRGG